MASAEEGEKARYAAGSRPHRLAGPASLSASLGSGLGDCPADDLAVLGRVVANMALMQRDMVGFIGLIGRLPTLPIHAGLASLPPAFA
jgi:hypothetical protein